MSSLNISLEQIQVPAGQMTQIQDLSWAEFEAFLEERGNDSLGRIRYRDGVVTILSPDPEHELSKEVIGDCIKIILQKTRTPAFPLGSTTLKGKPVGIEPGSCYYIESADTIRAVMISGQRSVNLETDPPPDLALEIDVASLTDIETYLPLKIPEVWIYRPCQHQLDLYWLMEEKYVLQEQSLHFPMLDIKKIIPEWLDRARQQDPMTLEVEFRQWLGQHLASQDFAN